MKGIRLLFVLLLVFVNAYAEFGKELSQGVRQEGLGGAFTGLADDGEAVVFNQAGLVNLKTYEFMLSYSKQMHGLSDMGMGINVAYLGYAHNFGDDWGAIGFRWYNRRFESDVFEASENMFSFGYAHKIVKGLSLGVGVNYTDAGFYNNDGLQFFTGDNEISKGTWSADASAHYNYKDIVSFGATVQNINQPDRSIDDGEFEDDIDYRFGIAWHYYGKSAILADYVKENEYKFLKAGVEHYIPFGDDEQASSDDAFVRNLILRAGAEYGLETSDYDVQNFTAGLGIDLKYGLRLDYAFKYIAGDDIKGDPMNHSVALVFTAPEKKREVIVEEPVRPKEPEVVEVVEAEPEPVVIEEPVVEEEPDMTPQIRTVKSGEYLIAIAKEFSQNEMTKDEVMTSDAGNRKSDFWERLYFYNKETIDNDNRNKNKYMEEKNIKSFDLIYPGQDLKIYPRMSIETEVVNEVTSENFNQPVDDVVVLRYKRNNVRMVLKGQMGNRFDTYDFYLYSSRKEIKEGKAESSIEKIDENFKKPVYPGQVLIILNK